MATAIREPAVAGRFYPANAQRLRAEVESFLTLPAGAELEPKIRALGCIVPHAAYMYSGHVAGAVYRRLELPQCAIILCPNHTGMGEPLAIVSRGAWRTPLGDAPVAEELATELMQSMPLLSEDEEAHRSEHGLEVQLPFLQVLDPDFQFVPIAIGTSNFEVLSALGVTIANTLAKRSDRVLIVASSDMNHYENDAVTQMKDRRAIEQLLALDPQGLYDVVRNGKISMCGYGPAVIMLTAAKKLGAQRAELISYATSGDVSGDKNMVVGYAGITIF